MDRRLFLALWPDESVRDSLVTVQRTISQLGVSRHAAQVRRENLHITLHFLGQVNEAQEAELVQCLDDITCASFDIELATTGCFSRAQILWYGLQESPAGLLALYQKTADCVQKSLPTVRSAKFVPHVSLFRKTRKGVELNNVALRWRVDNFVLVESVTWAEGVEYRIIKEWGLR